jgi:hypothetical protein
MSLELEARRAARGAARAKYASTFGAGSFVLAADGSSGDVRAAEKASQATLTYDLSLPVGASLTNGSGVGLAAGATSFSVAYYYVGSAASATVTAWRPAIDSSELSFQYWMTKSDGSGVACYYSGNSISLGVDTTLYAVWSDSGSDQDGGEGNELGNGEEGGDGEGGDFEIDEGDGSENPTVLDDTGGSEEFEVTVLKVVASGAAAASEQPATTSGATGDPGAVTTGGGQTATGDTSGGDPAGGSTAEPAGDQGSGTSEGGSSGNDQAATDRDDAVLEDDDGLVEGSEQPDDDGTPQ